VEWVERFIIAREQGITKENIISGWRGAGLFPENMHRILSQLIDYEDPTIPKTLPLEYTIPGPFFPNSSPPGPASAHTINQAFFTEISNSDITSPYNTQVRQLSNFMERYQAEALMYKMELNDVKEINVRHKERESGKRHASNDTPVASTERIEKALKEHEEATNRKKKGKSKGKQKHTKRQVVSIDDDTDSNLDDSFEIEEHCKVPCLTRFRVEAQSEQGSRVQGIGGQGSRGEKS